MQPLIKYGLLNAIMGFLIGGLIAISVSGDGYEAFILIAPLSAFLTGSILWRLLVKDDGNFDIGRVIITGLLTGTISHYISFMFLNVALNLCYWTTGNCTDSLGGPPSSIGEMFTGAFTLSFFSLLFLGWLTAPGSVVIGLIVRNIEINKNVAQQ